MHTLVETKQCVSPFMQSKIVSISFTAFGQFHVVTVASVHASQDVWFLHSCSEHPKWCHHVGPEPNANYASQSRVVPNSFSNCGSILNFSIVFFIYCLWKKKSANTQTSCNTKHYFI